MRAALRVGLASLIAAAALLSGIIGSATASASTGSLYQHLVVSWSHNQWKNHDRATFQIPGDGSGDVICSENTTWIQMVPSDPYAENDMWSVKFQTKNGEPEEAVKEARVYRYSTPTSTIPHGTGTTSYEGFNKDTPIESSDSGSLIGLISRRASLTEPGGAGSATTSVHLSWAWSHFHTASAQCKVTATFVTPIAGKSQRVSEGVKTTLPSSIGPVGSFGLNWDGTSDYAIATSKSEPISIPNIGTLTGTCATDGDAYLTLTPLAGLTPFGAITTYQAEGDITNANNESTDYDYWGGGVGSPIGLPVNGFIVGKLWPNHDSSPTVGTPASQETEIIVSSIRKTNDTKTPADDYCEVAVQSISAPNPVF